MICSSIFNHLKSSLRSQAILSSKLFQVSLNNVAGYKDLPAPPKEIGKLIYLEFFNLKTLKKL
jgi:hypothetical protein